MADSTRIFVIDDHPDLRRAIISFLSATPEFSVCGEADTIETALPLLKEARPQITILDLTLRAARRVEAVKTVKEQCPKTKILVFSGHEESIYAPRVLRAGASGYIKKGEAIENLL